MFKKDQISTLTNTSCSSVGSVIITSLCVYCWVCWRNFFKYRSMFGKVMGKSKVCFWLTRYRTELQRNNLRGVFGLWLYYNVHPSSVCRYRLKPTASSEDSVVTNDLNKLIKCNAAGWTEADSLRYSVKTDNRLPWCAFIACR